MIRALLAQIQKIWSIIKGDRRGEGKDACTVIEGPEGKNHPKNICSSYETPKKTINHRDT
jgi:hypothetical protein